MQLRESRGNGKEKGKGSVREGKARDNNSPDFM